MKSKMKCFVNRITAYQYPITTDEQDLAKHSSQYPSDSHYKTSMARLRTPWVRPHCKQKFHKVGAIFYVEGNISDTVGGASTPQLLHPLRHQGNTQTNTDDRQTHKQMEDITTA